MFFSLSELANSSFSTSNSANDCCDSLKKKFGFKHRFVAARLSIGRSLYIPEQPPELKAEEIESLAIPLRGKQLFGEDAQAGAWLALITQHCGESEMSKRDFQGLVTRHWHRGAFLLKQDWDGCGQKMDSFVSHLVELAGFSRDNNQDNDPPLTSETTSFSGEIHLPVGEIARDLNSNEPVEFSINGAGGSPHMAIMGGVGSGKTRTALHIIKSLNIRCKIPLLAFDFKGDLTDSFSKSYGATLISPPKMVIPLDVLHVQSDDDTSIKTAAARIRDSIAAVKSRKPSGVQLEALREAVATVLLRSTQNNTPASLSDVASALGSEYESRGRKPDELTATLNEINQFELFNSKFSPADFFSRSWIIQLPQDGSDEMKRMIINLTLDALDRWINSQPDAQKDDQGARNLRHLTMLDEAHFILSTRLPALANLVRMSRSKGGSIMLVSQSPDDFEKTEDGYLDNMGMTLAFNTQAKPGPTKRIFGNNASLSTLKIGEAYCKIRSVARTQKIICWKN